MGGSSTLAEWGEGSRALPLHGRDPRSDDGESPHVESGNPFSNECLKTGKLKGERNEG